MINNFAISFLDWWSQSGDTGAFVCFLCTTWIMKLYLNIIYNFHYGILNIVMMEGSPLPLVAWLHF